MTGPSTMAHHHELHALVRDLEARLAVVLKKHPFRDGERCGICGVRMDMEDHIALFWENDQLRARLAEAERHQHGNTDSHCDYCGYPPQRDPNDSCSPPERESGRQTSPPDTERISGTSLKAGASPRPAAARSGGEHRRHVYPPNVAILVDDPDDERECEG